MVERWRKPMPFLYAGPSGTVELLGDRIVSGIEISISEESWARIRAGYLCPCGEPHETPWPDACPVCQMTRHRLQEEFGSMFSGRIPEPESISDELERLAETNERRKHRPESSILLPRGVNLD